jgi:hypothetical protein
MTRPIQGEKIMTELKAQAKVFGVMDWYRFRVYDDGMVAVWDSVAGHYTPCHSMSSKAKNRIRRIAKVHAPLTPYVHVDGINASQYR